MPVEIDFSKIGIRIRGLRREKNMTQEDLAHICEYSASHISAVETGERAPSLDLLILIANALGTTLDYLISDTPCVNTTYLINTQIAPKLEKCNAYELQIINHLLDDLLSYTEKHLSFQ